MPFYPGRSVALTKTKNFGGIYESASYLNVEENQAASLLNVEIQLDGTISPRLGFREIHTFAGTPSYVGIFYTTQGVPYWVVLSGGVIYRAPSENGPWTDITGPGYTDGTKPWVGCNVYGRLFLANGACPPLVIEATGNANTLKAASLLAPPANFRASIAYGILYVVVSLSARGESVPSHIVGSGPTTTLAWTQRLGASGYRIYKYYGDTLWTPFADINSGATTTFVDDGSFDAGRFARGIGLAAPPVGGTAFNTPADWETNGYPEGFAVLAKGQASHLMAWRKERYWCAALNNPFDWHTPNDAWDEYIVGGASNSILGVGSYSNYTAIQTSSSTFLYTGSTSSDFLLDRTIDYGGIGPNSFVNVGSDLLTWSQFGPTTLQRIQAGADIAGNAMSQAVALSVLGLNPAYAAKTLAWNHPASNKVIWCFPDGASTIPNKCLVIDTETHGWMIWDGWSLVSVTKDAQKNVYGLLSDGRLVQLHTTNLDGATGISWHYYTGYEDQRTFLEKNVLWVEVITDKRWGAYSFSWALDWDMGRVTLPEQVLTSTTTDGRTVDNQSANVSFHRPQAEGIGRYFQNRFWGNTGTGGRPRIMGWRPEVRFQGV